MLLKVYKKLLKLHGPQNWWPVSGKFHPPQFEVCVGAILTQNTNWRNVEKALENLKSAGMVNAEEIANARLAKLRTLVRPSGFYRQKAERLRTFARFVLDFDGNFYKEVTRKQLLGLKGIGKETADSMLLFACGRPFFVVDAYTRRLLSEMKIIKGKEDYDEVRKMFEDSLPKRPDLYKEFHALIVRNGKLTARRA